MKPIQKTTRETTWFDIDCSPLLGTHETVQSVSSVVVEPNDLAVTQSEVVQVPVTYGVRKVLAGQVVRVLITGGTIPDDSVFRDYTVRLLLVTSSNPQVEATVALRVSDSA
jgi:hypothetical protein